MNEVRWRIGGQRFKRIDQEVVEIMESIDKTKADPHGLVLEIPLLDWQTYAAQVGLNPFEVMRPQQRGTFFGLEFETVV